LQKREKQSKGRACIVEIADIAHHHDQIMRDRRRPAASGQGGPSLGGGQHRHHQ